MRPAGRGSTPWWLWPVLGLLLAGLVMALVWVTGPDVLGPIDFTAWWAAGRLTLRGQNPYDRAAVMALECPEEGWPYAAPQSTVMYNPPWVLPLLMPFGLLPLQTGLVLWLLLLLAAVLGSATLLWRLYGGPEDRLTTAWALSLGFLPTVAAFRGTLAPLILLGVVGFLVAVRRGRDWPAGAALTLAAFKPQLIYLLPVATLLWGWDRRRWGAPLGAALTAAALVGVACLWNPRVVAQYRELLATDPPVRNITGTLGMGLRLVFGLEHFWLHYVPVAAALVWLLGYWIRRRQAWDWTEEGPLLVLVSLLTSPYAWVYDYLLALPAILQLAAAAFRVGRRRPAALALACYLAVDGAAFALNLAGLEFHWFFWMVPVLMAAYLALRPSLIPPPMPTQR